jgi:hypothetical protein
MEDTQALHHQQQLEQVRASPHCSGCGPSLPAVEFQLITTGAP